MLPTSGKIPAHVIPRTKMYGIKQPMSHRIYFTSEEKIDHIAFKLDLLESKRLACIGYNIALL